jgi:hypothetical protein
LSTESSYRFEATEVVLARTAVTTHLSGAVVRGQGLSYTISVGKSTTQVVRLPQATYVRKLPGKWQKTKRPSATADPSRTLAVVLSGLTGATQRAAEPAVVIGGVLPAATAKTAGIPATAVGAQVTVTLDRALHVVQLTVHTATSAGRVTVPVTLTIAYRDFDAVPRLTPPR